MNHSARCWRLPALLLGLLSVACEDIGEVTFPDIGPAPVGFQLLLDEPVDSALAFTSVTLQVAQVALQANADICGRLSDVAPPADDPGEDLVPDPSVPDDGIPDEEFPLPPVPDNGIPDEELPDVPTPGEPGGPGQPGDPGVPDNGIPDDQLPDVPTPGEPLGTIGDEGLDAAQNGAVGGMDGDRRPARCDPNNILIFDGPFRMNLLTGVSQPQLENLQIPSGAYDWVQLVPVTTLPEDAGVVPFNLEARGTFAGSVTDVAIRLPLQLAEAPLRSLSAGPVTIGIFGGVDIVMELARQTWLLNVTTLIQTCLDAEGAPIDAAGDIPLLNLSGTTGVPACDVINEELRANFVVAGQQALVRVVRKEGDASQSAAMGSPDFAPLPGMTKGR
jgi:hypothetical protein